MDRCRRVRGCDRRLQHLFLAAAFLSDPPTWVLAAGAGAGAAVVAVAVDAGRALIPTSWGRATSRVRWLVYTAGAALAAVGLGPWVVLVLLGCGLVERLVRRPPGPARNYSDTGRVHSILPAFALWAE